MRGKCDGKPQSIRSYGSAAWHTLKKKSGSLNTKKLFAEALKQIVVQKSFSKVTVSELIRVCNVNRKTFYYHFTDVYDLLKWTLEQEAIDVVKNFDLIIDYEEAILFAMDYIEKNDVFLNNIYYSVSRDELKRFFYADFIEITTSVIKKIEELTEITVPKEFETFLSSFYTEAIAGTLLEWIVNKEKHDKQQVINYIFLIFRTALPETIKQYSSSEQMSSRVSF